MCGGMGGEEGTKKDQCGGGEERERKCNVEWSKVESESGIV